LSYPVIVRHLNEIPYLSALSDMQAFTANRSAQTVDELWLLQHPAVYTLGLAGRREHLLNVGNIPVYPTDRGGQVTYHGPGQLVAYILMDVQRRQWGVKRLVHALEQAVIDYLYDGKIFAQRRPNAPGVYVNDKKIAALGLRIRRGCSYHGLSFNVDMDMSPFRGINPCGYQGLEVTQLYDLDIKTPFNQVVADFLTYLLFTLDYHEIGH
jgi:lipoyl(octanoyl) transferase